MCAQDYMLAKHVQCFSNFGSTRYLLIGLDVLYALADHPHLYLEENPERIVMLHKHRFVLKVIRQNEQLIITNNMGDPIRIDQFAFDLASTKNTLLIVQTNENEYALYHAMRKESPLPLAAKKYSRKCYGYAAESIAINCPFL